MKIHQYVERQAHLNPHKEAVVDKNCSLSYEVLIKRSNQLANFLSQQGLSSRDLVPLLMHNSVHTIISILAILKLGASYVPLNTLMQPESLKIIIGKLRPKLVLLDNKHAGHINNVETKLIVDNFNYDDFEKNFFTESINNLCYTIFTSGTTGFPKGVMVSHKALENTFLSWQKEFNLQATDRHLQMANLGFDVFTGEWIRALCSGGTLIILPNEKLLRPKDLYEFMLINAVNSAEFVPAILSKLVEYLNSQSLNLFFMRRVICGSDLITIENFKKIYSLCGPSTHLINSYGLTETVIDSTYFEYNDKVLSQLSPHSFVPIGKPFSHVDAYIVNDARQELGFEVEGELLIGGSALAEGYWNQPDLTEEKYIHLKQNSKRVFCTGDKVYQMKDGNLVFLGRNNFIAKINGVRIELSEVESFLRKIKDIDDAIVVSHQSTHDPEKTELYAYLVCSNSTPSLEEIIKNLHDFGLNPRAYPARFYLIKSIPLNMNGKRERRIDSLEIIGELSRKLVIVPPKTKIEKKIWDIWSDLLASKNFGVTNTFFDCGGDSIKVQAMILKLEKITGESFSKRNICNPTILDLSSQIKVDIR